MKLRKSKLTKFNDRNEFTINMNTPNIQKNIYFITGASIDSKKLNQMRYASTIMARAGVIKPILPVNISQSIINIGKINNTHTDVKDFFKNNQVPIAKKNKIEIIYDIKLVPACSIPLSDQAISNPIINI
jgi:hypothetical protein